MEPPKDAGDDRLEDNAAQEFGVPTEDDPPVGARVSHRRDAQKFRLLVTLGGKCSLMPVKAW